MSVLPFFMSKTNPEFSDNLQTAPAGSAVGVGLPQGKDLVIKAQHGAYMFYGLLEEVDPATGQIKVDSVTWDGFNDGAKDGVLIIKTQKSVTMTNKDGKPAQVDVYLPKGHYRVVLRDDASPTGQIVGETEDFVIF